MSIFYNAKTKYRYATLLLIIIYTVAQLGLANSYRDSPLIFPQKLVYVIETRSSQENINTFNLLIENEFKKVFGENISTANINFILTLRNSLFSNVTAKLYRLGAESITITLRLVSENKTHYTVEVAIELSNVYTVIIRDKNLDGRYDDKIELVDIVYVDKKTNEVVTRNGYGLGELVFSLRETPLRKTSYILYNIQDWIETPSIPANGIATIVPVYPSLDNTNSYRINKVLANPEKLAGSIGPFIIPSTKIANNITSKEAREKLLRKCIDKNIKCISYSNGTLVIAVDTIASTLQTIKYKPWKYIVELSHREVLDNYTSTKIIEIYHGVEYRGKNYVAVGAYNLEYILYDKNTGILLEAAWKTSRLSEALPSTLTKLFGLELQSRAKGEEIVIKLVDTIPSLDKIQYNIGTPNSTRKIAYIATPSILVALLLAKPLLRKKNYPLSEN